MRVTHNTIYSNIVKYIDDNYDKLNEINEHISSGKRVLNISDAPLDASRIVEFTEKLKSINQYSRNLTTAGIWLKTTDNALMQLKNLNTQLKTIATQAATETYTYDQRKSMAVHVSTIADSMMNIANTEINGKYIFSGYKVDTQPFELNISSSDGNYSIDGYNNNFDLNLQIHMIDNSHYEFSVDGGNTWIDNNGNGYTIGSVNPLLGFTINSSSASAGDNVTFTISHEYVGDKGEFEVQVDSSQKIIVNKRGNEIFTKTGKNIFKTLGKLWAGMITNNRDMIQDAIPDLNNIEKNILYHDAEIGEKQNILNNFKANFLEDKNNNINKDLSKLQDADITEEMTNLAKQQMVYQATLKSAAMLSNLTILNYI